MHRELRFVELRPLPGIDVSSSKNPKPPRLHRLGRMTGERSGDATSEEKWIASPTVNRIKCQARTKSGESCKARATPSGWCSLHADPRRAAELGRISGESRRPAQTKLDTLSPPRTAGDLHKALGQIFSNVSSGQMDAKLGRSLAYIASILGRTTELSDQEIRLRALEQMISSVKAKGDQK